MLLSVAAFLGAIVCSSFLLSVVISQYMMNIPHMTVFVIMLQTCIIFWLLLDRILVSNHHHSDQVLEKLKKCQLELLLLQLKYHRLEEDLKYHKKYRVSFEMGHICKL